MPKSVPGSASTRQKMNMPATAWKNSSAGDAGRRTGLPLVRLATRRLAQPDEISRGIRHEARLQVGEALGAPVADRRAEMLDHLLEHRPRRSAQGHADLHALG